jgi:hypothetical protein
VIGRTTVEQKSRATRLYRRALRKGELMRPDTCSRCGKAAVGNELHGHHHNGYDDEHALDVVWLCRSCHRRMHTVTPYPWVVIKEQEANGDGR